MTKTTVKTLVLILVIAITMITGTASQVMAIDTDDGSSVHVTSVLPKGKGFYEVKLVISSGNDDLIAGKILVTSDVSSKEVNHDAVLSENTSSVRTLIKVIDKSSIDAKLIKVNDNPTVELLDVVPSLSGVANLYTATVKVSTGSESIQNVDLLFSSDMESFSLLASSAHASRNTGSIGVYTYALTTVGIHAMDSESVSVTLTSYDLR